MKADIRVIHEKNRQLYGERRIKDDLADLGKTVSRKRINRLMKEEELVCKTRRKFKATTNSRHNKPVAENLLNREFSHDKPDRAYVGDITYVPTREGWLYLSVFIDLCSRAVVGWSMDSRMTAALVTDSLQMAMWKRGPDAGLLVHSDRGSQYVSGSYQKSTGASTVNGAVEHFVKVVATELPNGIRINVVSPSLLQESVDVYGDFFPGYQPVSGNLVAKAYVRSALGVATGQVFKVH